jgi:adenylate kinase
MTRVTTVAGVGQSVVLKIAKRAIKRSTLKITVVATDAAHNSIRTTLKLTVR